MGGFFFQFDGERTLKAYHNYALLCMFVFFGHLCKLFMTHSWLLFLSDCLTSGVLVVNVTWRKRTYVGTLLDCTKHDWAPPR